MTQLNGFLYSKRSNSSNWFIDRILTTTSTLGQSELGINGYEVILHIPQSSKTGTSPSDSLVSYPLRKESLTPQQKCSCIILQPQPTRLWMLEIGFVIQTLPYYVEFCFILISILPEKSDSIKNLNLFLIVWYRDITVDSVIFFFETQVK